jgi:hypothetical protein
MNHSSEGRFDLREELRLIPKAMVAAAVLVFLGIPTLLILFVFRHDPHAPPVAVHILVCTLAGSVLGIFLLLIGYVNRDAKRRGMNSVLWTVLVLIVPNGIGFILYFVIRQPVMGKCPQCGATVNPAFNFCPKCKYLLHPVCPQCHRTIEVGETFCPYCSADLKVPAEQHKV